MRHDTPLQLVGISRSEDAVAASFFVIDDGSPRTCGEPLKADLVHRAISWVPQDGLAAAVLAPLPSPGGLLGYARVLEAIHQRIDILPARFDTVFPGEVAARDWLCQHFDRLVDDLARLRGTCEMGLRIELVDGTSRVGARVSRDAPAAPASGLAYLASRRDRFAQTDDIKTRSRLVIDRRLQQVESCFLDWRRLTSAQPEVIRLAFLVDRDCVDRFRGRLQSAGVTECEERHALLGPWPPFSFV